MGFGIGYTTGTAGGGGTGLTPDQTTLLNSLMNVADNTIPVKDGLTFVNSAMTNLNNQILSSDDVVVPPGSITAGNTVLSTGFREVNCERLGSGLPAMFTLQRFSSVGVSSVPYYISTAAESTVDINTATTEVSAGTSGAFTITATRDGRNTSFIINPAGTGDVTFEVRENDANGVLIFSDVITISTADTETEFTLRNPLFAETGDNLYITWDGVAMNGSTISTVFVPRLSIKGNAFTKVDLITATDYTATDVRDKLQTLTGADRLDATAIQNLPSAGLTNEEIQDLMSTTLVQGTGISIVYDDAAGTITISATSSSYDEPRLTNLAIDIPNRVDLNTDLNVAKTITFDALHAENIQGDLTLEVTTGDNKTITTPFTNGANSKPVTLSGITTSSETTVTFRLTGTDTRGGAFNSNTVSISVRNVPDHEQFYYGLSNTNNPASIDTATMTGVEATTGTQIVSTGTVSSGQYFIILTPVDHDITSIVDDVLQQEVIDIFTKTTNARQINSINYNSFVVGPLNAINSESYTLTLN